MNKKFLPIILFFLLTACNINNATENKSIASVPPGIDISIDKLNSEFILDNPDIYNNTMRNNDSLALKLRSVSTEELCFSGDTSIHIYKYDNNVWEDVDNDIVYSDKLYYLPGKDVKPSGTLIIVSPSIEELKKPVEIYVFVEGYKNDVQGEKVASFSKYILYP